MSSTQQLLLGEGAGGAAPVYIEDVFSTYLYKGNSLTQTITNNIDLSTKGGLVWIKSRDTTFDHMLLDTARGVTKYLNSNNTAAESTNAFQLTSFNSNGFTLGDGNFTNNSAYNYASWTFREQAKFFDVVTWSGNSVSGRLIPHNLGSAPGCIIVKSTDLAGTNWAVWHRSLATGYNLQLQGTNAAFNTKAQWFNSSTQGSSTTFEVGSDTDTNETGYSYVAYLFAHDAGGFGLTGTDNVISCGSFTTNGSGSATVSLGYEPQWLLVKSTGVSQNWFLMDTMRGMSYSQALNLKPNTSGAEADFGPNVFVPTATGFVETAGLSASQPYIYIAIRRGPMAVPTLGTSVFSPNAYAGTSSAQTQTTNFPVDLMIDSYRSVGGKLVIDRLRGSSVALETQATAAEDSLLNIGLDSNTGVKFLSSQLNGSGTNFIAWNFQRAPGFFDEVCYTGTGVATTVTHNLAAVPELMIVKVRSNASGWQVYASALANTDYLILNTDAASVNGGSTRWNSTTPTSSVFSIGTHGAVNGSGDTYVAYLFATCAGVSKVGSYTGTGTTLQINCGFTAGSRFVMIKRTDSTGDWYVWDSARGIIAGNDPYLLLNSTAAEVTNTDYVDTAATGFEISSTAPAGINANGGTYIFLAIA